MPHRKAPFKPPAVTVPYLVSAQRNLNQNASWAMIEIDDFKQFEQPAALVKGAFDRQVSRLQIWHIPKASDAEFLFGTLTALLHGNPEVGPICLRPMDDKVVVAVL